MKNLIYKHRLLALVILCLSMNFELFSNPWLQKNLDKDDAPDFYPSIDQEEIQKNEEPSFSKFVNLEAKSQDFVLEVKQLQIPGFPHSFNPSIIRWKDNLLLVFRIRDSKTANEIGLVWLNDNFELISEPQMLQIPLTEITTFLKQQDPRLITIGDRLLMVYSNIIPGIKYAQVRRVFLTEIYFDGTSFSADPPECLTVFEGENEQRWEKNWTPFVYKGELLLSYSITPHRIFRLLGDGKCKTISSTLGHIQWNWGNLRGGTPALLDDGQYLSIFHSSKNMKTVHSQGKEMQHYFMGAYTFASEPPFNVTQISPEPIIGSNFYSSPPYNTWKPLRVVFPGGLLIEKDYVWILYGRQDFELWVAKLDKKELLKSLVPVSTLLK